MLRLLLLSISLLFCHDVYGSALVAEDTHDNLSACLKKTDEAPDEAAARSDVWLRKGGGDDARLCHAFAEYKRNEFQQAAYEFSTIASHLRTIDPRHAASLYAQAGLSYMMIKESSEAEKVYAFALKLDPNDGEIWLDRANERAENQHFWDAISDLNQAIKLNPKSASALRLRGQSWVKLGNHKQAEADFIAAEDIDPTTLPQHP